MEVQIDGLWSVISELPQKKSYKAIFLLFPILLAAVFGSYLYTAVGNGTGNSTSCTHLVPDSASLSFFANSTIAGTRVSFSNGTSSFYPSGVCPQPVQRALYNAISNVSQDARFFSKENGSQFTIDPVVSGPLTLANGSVVVALIFNHLNLSDPIFPCNLNEVSGNPLAQIVVVLPVLPNGSYVYANPAVFSYSGTPHFSCPPETGLETFSRSQIPAQFVVGGFSFKQIFNGTNYVNNGTSYPGFDYVFNVTYVAANVTQTVVFNWSSFQSIANDAQPSPFVSTLFSSGVVMRWFSNSTLYLTVTTLG